MFVFSSHTDDKDDKQDIRVLNELENIDDELEKEGIVIVRIDNADEAREYGLDHLPTLIYFEDKIPALYEGDLMNEDEVLEWLILQKETDTIEEVTDEILQDLIDDHEYVVAYFSGPCEEGDRCDSILGTHFRNFPPLISRSMSFLFYDFGLKSKFQMIWKILMMNLMKRASFLSLPKTL